MIDLGKPALFAEGVTLFPDHAEAGRFHYLPGGPGLRFDADGKPELKILEYRLDPSFHEQLGAGLLSLTVDLAVDEDRLERLRLRASRHVETGTRVVLTPVAAESGTCELILIDRSSRDGDAPTGGDAPDADDDDDSVGFGLVERILGAATPGLYGANAATFQAVLSAEGVSLVEGALAGGGLPVGVVYNLRVLGLRPALRAEITAHWQQIYDFFEARVHGGRLLAAIDVGPTMEDLVQREAIEIHIDELVPADERSDVYDRAIAQAQRYVTDKLFKPSLGLSPPMDPAAEESGLATIGRAIKDIAGFFTINHSLRHLDRSELKTFRYRLQAAQAEPMTLAPQGTLQAVLPEDLGLSVDDFVVQVEPTASREMRFDVAPSVDLAAEGIDHLEVALSYGDRSERLMLDAVTPRREVVFWFEPELGSEIDIQWEAHLNAAGSGLQGVIEAPAERTDHRVLRLDPRQLWETRTVRVFSQGIPFDKYPRVLVDLKVSDPLADWSDERSLELTAEALEQSFQVRSALGARWIVERRIRYLETDGGEVVLDWQRVAAESEVVSLVIPDPLPDIVDVLVLAAARFGTAVRRLVVELRPKDRPEEVTPFLLTAEEASATWAFQPGENEGREYEYRVTVHTVRSELREGPWLPGPPGKLVVGEGGQARQIEMMFVGPSPADLGLLALKVRFAYDDPESGLSAEDEVLVEDTRQPLQWSYPVADPNRQTYSFQLTLIHSDGRIEKRDPINTSDLLVIQPLT
ncbi:MAG: hypothetical protein AAF481_12320 [Acidobacteriota bacterium]